MPNALHDALKEARKIWSAIDKGEVPILDGYDQIIDILKMGREKFMPRRQDHIRDNSLQYIAYLERLKDAGKLPPHVLSYNQWLLEKVTGNV
jgi:hypothetical protein